MFWSGKNDKNVSCFYFDTKENNIYLKKIQSFWGVLFVEQIWVIVWPLNLSWILHGLSYFTLNLSWILHGLSDFTLNLSWTLHGLSHFTHFSSITSHYHCMLHIKRRYFILNTEFKFLIQQRKINFIF